MRDLIANHYCVDDAGKKYLVAEYARRTEYRTLAHGSVRGHGASEWCLDDGSGVNKINDTSFEIVDSGKRLRKIS